MRKPEKRKNKGRRRGPGEAQGADLIAAMIRVDQAGEFGAQQIYKGQLAVLAGRDSEPVIREMAAQEAKHLACFNELMAARQVRPTALTPIWRLGAYALGAGTALLGEKAAMACTVAVEEVIEEHYQAQLQELADLSNPEPELAQKIAEFRADELQHRDIGLAQGARQAPGYPILRRGIKAATRLAIRLSSRI